MVKLSHWFSATSLDTLSWIRKLTLPHIQLQKKMCKFSSTGPKSLKFYVMVELFLLQIANWSFFFTKNALTCKCERPPYATGNPTDKNWGRKDKESKFKLINLTLKMEPKVQYFLQNLAAYQLFLVVYCTTLWSSAYY